MSEIGGMGEIGLFEAMSTCRTIRRLRPDPIPDHLLHKVLMAATWAPSGGNRQAWRFVVVRDPAKRLRLRELYQPLWEKFSVSYRAGIAHLPEERRQKGERMVLAADHLARHLDEAPVIVVVCVHVPELAITDAGLDRPPVVGGASIYTAVQNLLLACRGVGLGGALTTLLCMKEPEVKELLGIPEGWGTCAFIPIGYPDGRGHGPLDRRPVEKVACLDHWDQALFPAHP